MKTRDYVAATFIFLGMALGTGIDSPWSTLEQDLLQGGLAFLILFTGVRMLKRQETAPLSHYRRSKMVAGR